MKTQFVTDKQGKKVAVLISIGDYKKMIGEIEELDDIRAFDKAKREDREGRILFSDYLKKRKAKNGKIHRQLVASS